MAAQGFDRGLPYAVTPEHRDASWILDGVDPTAPIGDHGLVLGGAAGLEIDRIDGSLGSPPNLVRIATATGFSDSYQHAIEEVPSSDSKQGGTVCADVRADLVYFDGPHDGAVFATGSIAWCGALSHSNYDNPVSRITENVLRRFRS